MSIKQQLTQAVADLPESVSLEEAFERLYRAFRAQQEALQRDAKAAPGTLAALRGWVGAVPGLSGASSPDAWVDLLREDRQG
jgi:hypothetical protein